MFIFASFRGLRSLQNGVGVTSVNICKTWSNLGLEWGNHAVDQPASP